LAIHTKGLLQGVTGKAVDETYFPEANANMCRVLSMSIVKAKLSA
jgi:hypothetical protein